MPIIPKEIIQREYIKSLNAHSYHSMLKDEFAFNDWLTKINDKDTCKKINTQIDSLMYKHSKTGKTALNLSDNWHLFFFINRGWYQVGIGRSVVNRCYVCYANKFRLSGSDLIKIFKTTEGWTAFNPSENKLIFLYGYFYPNGNQTSWDYQNINFFSK